MNLEFLLLPMVFIPILLGFLPLFVKNVKNINLVLVIACAIELVLCVYFLLTAPEYAESVVDLSWFGGFGIAFKVNGLGVLQAVLASVIWVGASIFSLEYFEDKTKNLRRYYAFFSVTFGATLGVFLANDLFTLFVFFEVMSFASYALVAHDQNEASSKAGNTYLVVAVIGGLSMLAGIFMINALAGTTVIDQLVEACKPFYNSSKLLIAGFLVFTGFAAKAGAFPVNGWLPKAHTAAPAPVSAALSGILTKCGIYGIILVTFRILQGNTPWAIFILIIGVLTMVIGAFFAFLSTNLKETMAYSTMSQIGFIIIGISMAQLLGSHGTIAVYGTVLHMLNHTLIKLVLFTCAGVIYKNTHTLDLNKLQGYGRNKPMLAIFFGTASLGIMGVPLFSGYISKTLLHEAIVEQIAAVAGNTDVTTMLQVVEILFLVSGGLTVAYMTKLFICLFIKKPKETHGTTEKPYISLQTGAVLSVVSGLIFAFGAFPTYTLDKIAAITADFMGIHALEESVHYFAMINLEGAAISITIGIFVYFVIARFVIFTKEDGYKNPWNKDISTENLFWKPLVFGLVPYSLGFFGRIIDKSSEMLLLVVLKMFFKPEKIPKAFFNSEKQAEDEKVQSPAISITYSLSYSLLLFGIGFMVTMLYLLFSKA